MPNDTSKIYDISLSSDSDILQEEEWDLNQLNFDQSNESSVDEDYIYQILPIMQMLNNQGEFDEIVYDSDDDAIPNQHNTTTQSEIHRPRNKIPTRTRSRSV